MAERRAQGALQSLAQALALEDEDGDVPARGLAEHLADARRKRKLLLTQLRVLQRLLGGLQGHPGPTEPPAPRLGEARGRWRGLKSRYGAALGGLEGALPPALARLQRGQRLRGRLGDALRGHPSRRSELEAKLLEARGRRDQPWVSQLRGRLEEQRELQRSRGAALTHSRGAARRGEAGCRLYRLLTCGVPHGESLLPPKCPPLPHKCPPLPPKCPPLPHK
ncbi:ZW10 interactor [Phaenicophaeus curvirostris]|uniref:ZW10 interactor n=1 Tax=Phaenicophaeus curvirostris TaxID=33595 RepID=UPI0037F0F0D4